MDSQNIAARRDSPAWNRRNHGVVSRDWALAVMAYPILGESMCCEWRSGLSKEEYGKLEVSGCASQSASCMTCLCVNLGSESFGGAISRRVCTLIPREQINRPSQRTLTKVWYKNLNTPQMHLSYCGQYESPNEQATSSIPLEYWRRRIVNRCGLPLNNIHELTVVPHALRNYRWVTLSPDPKRCKKWHLAWEMIQRTKNGLTMLSGILGIADGGSGREKLRKPELWGEMEVRHSSFIDCR